MAMSGWLRRGGIALCRQNEPAGGVFGDLGGRAIGPGRGIDALEAADRRSDKWEYPIENPARMAGAAVGPAARKGARQRRRENSSSL